MTLATTRLGRSGAPPALLAHCFLGHRGTWARLVARLARPLDALAFDLPGHGESPMPAAPGDFHAEVAALVPKLLAQIAPQGAPVLGIGHSFGGAVLLRHALLHPATVAGLVLIEPVFFAVARGRPEYDVWEGTEAPVLALVAAGQPEAAARLFLEANGDGTPWAAIAPRDRARMTAQIPLLAATVAGLVGDSGGLLAPGRMEGFDAPVLLLTGQASPPIFGAVCQELARRLGRAEVAEIAGAGHMLPITHPAEVAARIDDWRARHRL